MSKGKSSITHRVLSAIGIFLCVIFGFMLICNITIIIKGSMNPDVPPSVLSVTPMVVLSGSMSGTQDGHIEIGDIIFISPAKTEELKTGDIISFMEKGSTSVVTHRITQVIKNDDGTFSYRTKGDANNSEDTEPVTADRIIGIYTGRIPKVGDFAMFLQTPLGMILFIGVPLLAFIIYDIIRRQHYANKEKKNTSELEAELERLRRLAGENGAEQNTAGTSAEEEASGAEASEKATLFVNLVYQLSAATRAAQLDINVGAKPHVGARYLVPKSLGRLFVPTNIF